MHGVVTLAVLFVVSFSVLAQTPEERGLAIAQEADRQDQGWEDSVADLVMILRNEEGEEALRRLHIKTLENTEQGDRSLTEFETPRDLRGTALLTYTYKNQPDDQWLYLPAIKRVKRIAAQNQSGPFMGSEFAFEDMSSQEVEKFTYRYLRDEPCPDLPGDCFVIQRTPVSEYSGYSHQVVWIDQAEYRIDKVDYYDRKEELLKTLRNQNFQQYLDAYWRPGKSLMVNHQTGKSTELRTESIEFRTGLSPNDFNPSRLGR
ncbi:outer membrane lipoprotein-sorting protein [Marinobacteraceae bacterium S3BR75-40.1]